MAEDTRQDVEIEFEEVPDSGPDSGLVPEPESEQRRSSDSAGELLPASEELPATLAILPLSERPLFPPQTLPVLLDEIPWMETLEQFDNSNNQLIGLLAVRQDLPDGLPTIEDFYAVGTVMRVHHPMSQAGKLQFIAEGVGRFRVLEWISREPPLLARVEYPEEPREDNDRLKAYALAIINTLKDLLPLNPLYSEEVKFFLNRFGPNEPSSLTDFAASLTTASREQLQEVLEALDLQARMEKVLVLIKKEVEVAKLQSQIRQQVEEKLTEQQRRFFLGEQLKAIQQELGISKDDRTADLDRYRERLEGLTLPEKSMRKVDEEMDKLAILETGSPEYGVTRNYLDWITALPWGKCTADKLSLARARQVLDKDHDGLDDVKDRIIEFLAIGAYRGEISGSILLLVGPPGVGKTSIGRSIATALGREFYRFSVGGMRDEAEIKGHRRTYIGAMPGKIIQAIKEVGSSNPVIMLDEIDKIGRSFRGDPASALLEVLDPEQNSDFLDHFLDTRYDLSKVLFICTANQLDGIPGPLFDRMELIRLSGYITAEKMAIARHHLWPRQRRRAGLKASQLRITDAAMRKLIEGYARGAGVRGLEKQLGRIVRKAVVRIIDGSDTPISIGIKDLEDYLGKRMFRNEQPMSGIGIVTGLAWTSMGGATLSIEANLVHSRNRGFQLTGKLGDVMRESAQIAYSHVTANLKAYKGRRDFFDGAFVHLHVPEGATPKDGPSAGVTMAVALLSLARRQKPAQPLAMTGELTLTGRVLAVGGIREKVIAARRVRICELILPAANQGDFEELPEHLREGLKVHFAQQFRDVVKVVFGKRDG